MSYLYLFDLIDFDQTGSVCKTNTCDLNQSQQNYLYLISKLNQNFLKTMDLQVPTFFKQDLQNVLKMPYAYARKEVFANCLPEVEKYSNLSDRDAVLGLFENVKITDKIFASKVNNEIGKAVNDLNIEYILTGFSGQKYDKIMSTISNGYTDPVAKSKLFKDIITYNSLINLAANVNNKQANFVKTASATF